MPYEEVFDPFDPGDMPSDDELDPEGEEPEGEEKEAEGYDPDLDPDLDLEN